MKEYDEGILMYQNQVNEKDEETSECKKQKREMEDDLLTIAGLSSLDELKDVLKKSRTFVKMRKQKLMF